MTQPLECNTCARIVHDAPDAILFCDPEGVIRFWNSGAEHLFGYSAGEAIGQSLDIIIPERLRQRHWDGYFRVMKTGESHYGKHDLLSVPALRKDGSQVPCAFSILLLRDESGEAYGIASIMRDASKAREREQELKARIAALEAELEK
ncbi:MAG: PAS domain S-box protein [Geobacteraceae bacterium]|nr:PAS domain S-box protein [Geobacteraceae bacterium]